MSDLTQKGWASAALAAFFLVVGVRDLTVDPPNLDAASWELLFAAANALLFWRTRGGAPWTQTVGYALFVGAVLAAAADLFF